MPAKPSHLHGLLVVDKPGLPLAHASTPQHEQTTPWLPTSHDIVQKVRRWSRERRIGHTGTLDPLASGVMVLCLGQATRLVEYYQGHPKQYYAEILLGAATDSYDALGAVTMTAPVPPVKRAQLETVLQQFRGSVLQLPPVYSALKQGGESAHRKARRGETVTMTPRPVTFYQLDLLTFDPPDRLALRLVCSAGTYVRSLAHDLGRALGTYGHLVGLRREAAGPFGLSMAHEMAVFEAAAQADQFATLLLPPGFGLALPKVELDETAVQRLGFGQQLTLTAAAEVPAEQTLAQAYDAQGQLRGIIRRVDPPPQHLQVAGPQAVWKAEKWFVQDV